MNILQIVPKLELGGVERGVLDFSEYLIKQGHKSVVISSGGSLVKDLEKKGAFHYTLPVHKKSLFSFFYCIREVKKIIFKEKIEIVHSRSRVPHWIGCFASLKTPAQFLITAHGYYSQHFFSKIVRLPKVVIAPSKSLAKYLVEELKVLPSKIRVIPRGLKIEDFSFKEPSFRDFSLLKIGYIGRISPVKGVEYFIGAVNELVRDYPGLKAYIVGEASKKHLAYKEFLQKKVKKLGLSENIRFLGKTDPRKILEEIHFLVLPSLIPESFGRVIIEAQAKGVVCVATDLGGPKELIKDSQTGFLVPGLDSSGIAEKIKESFKNKSLYAQIVFRARRQVEENYTLEKMAEKTLEVYNKLSKQINILVIKLSSLGDVVLGTATFRTLKKYFPHSYLAVLCSRAYLPIIENLDFIDELFIYEDKIHRLKELAKLSSVLRERSFDVVLDLQNNYFSHLLSYLIFPKMSIGFKRKWGFLIDKKEDFKKAKELGPLQSQKKLLNLLGIDDIEKPFLKVDKLALSKVEEVLEEAKFTDSFLVGINVEASAKWKTKNLKPPFLRLLVDFLTGKGLKVVLIGRKESFLKAENLRKEFSQNVLNLCGKTNLKELVSLISKLNLFISSDSAPLHIAVALNKPSIGVFGPTLPQRHIVLGERVFVVKKNLPCLGCYKKSCRHSLCMEIAPEEFSPFIERLTL
ncbi:MAG TPA: glycosyltransferase [Candidatus Omnitrophica bacterium]|nr:glycosyltransferase [Candidatus Omnitrophota bacterium]